MRRICRSMASVCLIVGSGIALPQEQSREQPQEQQSRNSNSSSEELLLLIQAQQTQLDEQRKMLDQLRAQIGRFSGNEFSGNDFTPQSQLRSIPAATATSAEQQRADPGAVQTRATNLSRDDEPRTTRTPQLGNNFSFGGYAIVNYENFDWDTQLDRRARTDLERLILEAEYQPTEMLRLEAEIEFEHGGVGTAIEFDVFEEFGEFEQEVEQGGEIVVEKLQAELLLDRSFNIKIGHIMLPIGMLNKYHNPSDYFTSTRESSRTQIIPETWHENGIGIFGEFDGFGQSVFDYELQVINGLDSTGFSSANWVAPGFQTRFEYKVAENLGYAANVNFRPTPNAMFGASYFHGNSAENRPKDDVNFDADVDIYALFGSYTAGPLTLRGQYMEGELQNSDLITQANRRLSNNLGVVRTPVAESARALFAEVGYDISEWFRASRIVNPSALQVFFRHEEIDNMEGVEGLVFKNPRWDRESRSIGLNYYLGSGLIWKLEKKWRELGTTTLNEENTLSTSISYEF